MHFGTTPWETLAAVLRSDWQPRRQASCHGHAMPAVHLQVTVTPGVVRGDQRLQSSIPGATSGLLLSAAATPGAVSGALLRRQPPRPLPCRLPDRLGSKRTCCKHALNVVTRGKHPLQGLLMCACRPFAFLIGACCHGIHTPEQVSAAGRSVKCRKHQCPVEEPHSSEPARIEPSPCPTAIAWWSRAGRLDCWAMMLRGAALLAPLGAGRGQWPGRR
jgi:hypothetical protein